MVKSSSHRAAAALVVLGGAMMLLAMVGRVEVNRAHLQSEDTAVDVRVGSCARISRDDIGMVVTVEGRALHDQKMGTSIETAQGPCWVYQADWCWPNGISGHIIRVTGLVEERCDLPVFVEVPGEPAIAGMPQPPGTDLNEARKRLVLANPRWKLVK